MSSKPEHKLYNYQQDPPPAVWDAIVAGLDGQQNTYPEKLYNYQAVPPPAVWQKIEDQLPVAENGGKVVAMPVGRKIFRYAAAAVLLLALVGIAYFAAPDNEGAVATTNSSLANPAIQPPTVKREIKHFNVPPQAAAMPDLSTSNTNTYAVLEKAVKRIRQKQAKVTLPIEPIFASALAIAPTQKNMVDAERTERYMIATTDNGAPVRLPKKVYSAFACPDDEPTHQACELQLTLLQQKMSTSLTTDFAQFLDLLKNLQENSR